MNPHLQAVRELRSVYWPPADRYRIAHLSDMEVVVCQTGLMAAGSLVGKALKQGEMAAILAGLVKLAYCALTALAMLDADLVVRPVNWRHDGSVLSVMTLLSRLIANCASGSAVDYSEAYCASAHLASRFLNADFDRAMTTYLAARANFNESTPSAAGMDDAEFHVDLSDCLYE